MDATEYTTRKKCMMQIVKFLLMNLFLRMEYALTVAQPNFPNQKIQKYSKKNFKHTENIKKKYSAFTII